MEKNKEYYYFLDNIFEMIIYSKIYSLFRRYSEKI